MKAFIAPLLFASTLTHAATVAIIDSGMDYKHEAIVKNLWVNTTPSEKNSLYQNVMYGWNFVENNNQVIDYSHLGTFSSDIKKFFDLQAKAYLFEVTDEEKAWAKEKLKDKEFEAELERFGNFVHGTHVAGIAVKKSGNKAMGVKLIPTMAKKALKESLPDDKGLLQAQDPWKTMQVLFTNLALQRNAEMVKIGQFLRQYKVDVANGSFGTGIEQAAMIGYEACKLVLKREPTDEELKRAAILLMNTLVKVGQIFVAQAPSTLFVFAAGNDGLSNDDYGASPANIKADNTIAVAATYEDQFFAPFSNWGVKMVEVAAPGLNIRSSIPGNDYATVSGTSQAAPFVANVAGRIKDANPKLRPVEIKKILMGTVDKKAFLAIRVTSGGIVNAQRAVAAAELSKIVTLEEAISRANLMVPQKKSLARWDKIDMDFVRPMPLLPEFQ